MPLRTGDPGGALLASQGRPNVGLSSVQRAAEKPRVTCSWLAVPELGVMVARDRRDSHGRCPAEVWVGISGRQRCKGLTVFYK